eukprot:SAG31_NODE_1793_length_7241_cov_2.075611_7_plen_167_part_00
MGSCGEYGGVSHSFPYFLLVLGKGMGSCGNCGGSWCPQIGVRSNAPPPATCFRRPTQGQPQRRAPGASPYGRRCGRPGRFAGGGVNRPAGDNHRLLQAHGTHDIVYAEEKRKALTCVAPTRYSRPRQRARIGRSPRARAVAVRVAAPSTNAYAWQTLRRCIKYGRT